MSENKIKFNKLINKGIALLMLILVVALFYGCSPSIDQEIEENYIYTYEMLDISDNESLVIYGTIGDITLDVTDISLSDKVITLSNQADYDIEVYNGGIYNRTIKLPFLSHKLALDSQEEIESISLIDRIKHIDIKYIILGIILAQIIVTVVMIIIKKYKASRLEHKK